MEVIKTRALKKAIILVKVLQNGKLLVVDSDTTIMFLDRNNLSTIDGFKVNINHPQYSSNIMSFSDNARYFATTTADSKESRLYDANTKKLITSVDRHHGEVSCVAIDPLNRYMFSSGDDGKTFAIDIKSGKLVFTLPVHVDTVNDIAFSANSNWIATASYDRKISLFNLVTMKAKNKLKAHTSPVMKLKFLSNNRLFSIDKKSSAIIWDVHSGKLLRRLQGIHDDVTQVTVSGDDKFLFLATELGYVLVYSLQTYKLLSPKYIKIKSRITALCFDDQENHLVIGTKDGELIYYDIYDGQDKLKELLKSKKFLEMEKELLLNPILEYTNIYAFVSEIWKNTLNNAIIALQSGNEKKAIAIFDPFKNIPSKNRIIKATIQDYSEFEKFTTLAKTGKLALAYGLANAHPIYKKSKLYKSLELRWQKTFTQAQKYVIEPRGADMAKEILSPYRGISEKTRFIQELLTQGDVYKRFRDSVGQKDFKISFELIKQHEFLKEFPDYEILMSYADSLYIKSHKFIAEGDTHSAMKMLTVLSEFSDFKEEVEELMLEVDSRQKFFKAIDENDMNNAYEMMDISEDLQDTKDGIELQNKWNKDLSSANSYASSGDSLGLNKVLKNYMKVQSKYTAIATEFAWCHMVQLENALDDKINKKTIENGIKNYMVNFGFQEQLESFFYSFKKIYPDSKLSLDKLTQGEVTLWKPSMIVDSILE